MKKKRKKRKMKRTDWEIKPHNKVINRIGLNDLEFTDVKEVEVIITIPKRKKFSDKVVNKS